MKCINDAGQNCAKCGGHMKELCTQVNSPPPPSNIERRGFITVLNGDGKPTTGPVSYWLMMGSLIAKGSPRDSAKDGSIDNTMNEHIFAAHRYASRTLRIARKLIVNMPLTITEKLVLESHDAGCWEIDGGQNEFDPCDGCIDKPYCLAQLK